MVSIVPPGHGARQQSSRSVPVIPHDIAVQVGGDWNNELRKGPQQHGVRIVGRPLVFTVNDGKKPLCNRDGKAPVVKLRVVPLVILPPVAVWEYIEYVVEGSIPAT
jgi:hypothetical protein